MPPVTSTPPIMSSTDLKQGEKYVVDEDAALVILEDMYSQICCEDQTLRTFRRSLSFGHYIKRTLIPLLMSTKREPIIELTIRLLANLTLPVECLYSVDIMSRTEAGRKNIAEICSMLRVTKQSFADVQAVKAIVDYLKYLLERDSRMSPINCANINNCLIVLRNVLHIPNMDKRLNQGKKKGKIQGQAAELDEKSPSNIWDCESWSDYAAIQNQILYNLFSMSIDKLLIHLMSCSQREYFAVAMVQLIALMYKDQRITALQSLLSSWFDASMSDSSEDFESNTTPIKAVSGNSSPMLTSDSSDNGSNALKSEPDEAGKGESDETGTTSVSTTAFAQPPVNTEESSEVGRCEKTNPKSLNVESKETKVEVKPAVPVKVVEAEVIDFIDPGSRKNSVSSNTGSGSGASESRKKSLLSEMSDCGYGTQVESSGRPEVIVTTSSNEDEQPSHFHQHQKPPATNQKQRYNAVNNPRSAIARNDKKEWRRKKLVKRSKTCLLSMTGDHVHSPSDQAISNILKEFTVDFLLKCYGSLVKGLHVQLLSQPEPRSDIDTSHFFWLITFFLKLTAHLELDLEHVKNVLTLGIISFLTYEGVSLSEELMLLIGQEGVDKRSCLRRLHLVVTAIKEYLQTLDCFKRIGLLSLEDKSTLHQLTLQISDLTGLQCLFVMLLRNYSVNIHTKQYLQDIIVTNHILLVLLDEASKYTDYRGSVKMKDHIEQFATVEVMQQYGQLLTDYQNNGEFVNDCIFTMMHHIGGDIGQVSLLFQPNILKTFSQIFESEYELCDDWSDLIEYIIHKFLNTPQQSALAIPRFSLADPTLEANATVNAVANAVDADQQLLLSNVWSKEETDSLYWYYVQSRREDDPVGAIIQLYANNDSRQKSRIDVIQQLLQQDVIALPEYDDLMAAEDVSSTEPKDTNAPQPQTEGADQLGSGADGGCRTETADDEGVSSTSSGSGNSPNTVTDDIQVLKQRIIRDDKGKSLQWLQKTLLDSCYVKLQLKRNVGVDFVIEGQSALEPIPLHYTLKRQPIPVVPWNSEQSVVHLYPPFMLLLHKLGFHLPADSGKAFVRIPAFWTADILFSVAEKLGPVDQSMLRFDLGELHDAHSMSMDLVQVKQTLSAKDTTYGMHRRQSMIRFTPNPLTQYASNWLDIENQNNRLNHEQQRWQQMQVDGDGHRDGGGMLATGIQTQSPADSTVSIGHHHQPATAVAMTVTSTTATRTMAQSPIGHQLSSSEMNTAESVAIGPPNLGLERFPLSWRLPVLQESIDEVEEDEEDDEAEHESFDCGPMLRKMRLENVDSIVPGLNACETASVVSDLTHIYDLYVSDTEEP